MSERLRIAQVLPVAGAVTPQSTTSIEHLGWLLCEELVRRGHRVTLCSTGNSQTSAALHAVYPRGYTEDDELWDWKFHDTAHVASVFERARDFDVIHSHVYHYALPFIRLVRTPAVHTYHILPNQDIVRVFERYPEAHIAALSHAQRIAFRKNPDVVIIPHGIDTEQFPNGSAPDASLVFLGRMIPDKGPVEAIRLAQRAGMRLTLAGPSDDDEGYFRRAVLPLINGKSIKYVGAVGMQERNRLLAGAAVLLYPIIAPEPFGLVLVEAMACGTPVLAHGIGAVPEIVENGVTGYHTPDLESLIDYLPATLALDRARVRQTAMARFDFRRMVDRYEALYRRLVPGGWDKNAASLEE